MQRSFLNSQNYLIPQSQILRKLQLANEEAWLLAASTAEVMNDFDRALILYQNALNHSPYSIQALSSVGTIHHHRENYSKAIEFYQRALNVQQDNGDIWSALGHSYLMIDDLQKAYTAYQQALYHLPSPKLQDPKLWYGIGILYDRYGSLEHAEEAFAGVIKISPEFEKANEIYFRLGIIYKQQQKFSTSLDCFRYILTSPPKPLSEIDIWFQIGHVYEQQKEYTLAREAYERVLMENPEHAKVLQQLGWLYHQTSLNSNKSDQDLAIQYLTKSLGVDPTDPQSWYLLGRAYMSGQKFNKAYEAYQQAVYRDGRNPTFWCSIGVLYYQINQYRDALDAYSRAIRLNPYISEVWFDLGSLYESCHNQISDAIDAYARAADLDPTNPHIKQRLQLLRNVQANGGSVPSAPVPQDVHPTAYASSHAITNRGGVNGSNEGQYNQNETIEGHQPVPRVVTQSEADPTVIEQMEREVMIRNNHQRQQINYQQRVHSPVPVVDVHNRNGLIEGQGPQQPNQQPQPLIQQPSSTQFINYTPAHYEERPPVEWDGRPMMRYNSPMSSKPPITNSRNASVIEDSRRKSVGSIIHSPPMVSSHPPHLSQPYERNGLPSRNSRYDPRMDVQPVNHLQLQGESPPRVTPAKSNRGRKSLAYHAARYESDSNQQTPVISPQSSQFMNNNNNNNADKKPSIKTKNKVNLLSDDVNVKNQSPQPSTSTSKIDHYSPSQSQSPPYSESPQTPAVPPVARVVDEDYDEGAADALMGLAGAATVAANDEKNDNNNHQRTNSDERGYKRALGEQNDNVQNKRQRELSPNPTGPLAFPRKYSMNNMTENNDDIKDEPDTENNNNNNNNEDEDEEEDQLQKDNNSNNDNGDDQNNNNDEKEKETEKVDDQNQQQQQQNDQQTKHQIQEQNNNNDDKDRKDNEGDQVMNN